MKKLLFYICTITCIIAGCTKDEESYPISEGPEVSIAVSEIQDHSFTVTLAPAAAASYYSYLVEESGTAGTKSAASILKVVEKGLAAGTVKYENNKTYSFTVKDLSPNATYQVYAVATNPAGFTGKVANQSVITTDGDNPVIKSVAVAKDTTVILTFSESIKMDEGKLFVTYYARNSGTAAKIEASAVELIIDPSKAAISGSTATIDLGQTVPNGADICVTWEANTFSDIYGNYCAAMTNKGYDAAKKAFKGVAARRPVKAWDFKPLEKETVYFSKWDDLMIQLSPDTVAAYGTKTDVTLAYITKGKKVTLDLTKGETWGKMDGCLVAFLPEEPERGAVVDLSICDDAVQDKYGNPNTAFLINENNFLYSYNYKMSDIVGTYTYIYADYFNGGAETEWGTFTISQIDDIDSVLLTGIFDPEVSIKGYFDRVSGTLSVPDSQYLGTHPTYGDILWANANDGSDVVFEVPVPHRAITNMLCGIYGPSVSGFFALGTQTIFDGQKAPSSIQHAIQEITPKKAPFLKQK